MPMDPLTEQIERLKHDRNAIILAHNYQLPEVQDTADYVGDSLGLSRTAAASDAEVIVFCGVRFMAETAAILCPGKTILIPEPEAGCPMVDMAPVDEVRKLKQRYPDAVVLSYVNSSAAVKAESDCCCTSSNAVAVVASIDPSRRIIFIPDRYLGSYVADVTGRDLVLYEGYCPTHARILAEDIVRLKAAHPAAEVMVHPECPPDVVERGDCALSTGGMLAWARESAAREFIVCTELGLVYRLRREHPDKQFYPVSEAAVCPNMKKIDREKILRSLEDMVWKVRVPAAVARRARRAVESMVETLGVPAAPGRNRQR